MAAIASTSFTRLVGTSLLSSVLLSSVLLWIGFLAYGSTGHDDSHINFWNVHTLLTRGELVNYNFERIEQTTSLLQDLLTALLALIFPLHLVTLGYLVDIAAALACCVLATHLARQLAPSLAGWTPLLTLSSSNFLLWAFGGMGAPLTALCLLAGTVCWRNWFTATEIRLPQLLQLCVTNMALVLVRPEMPVVIVAITAALAVTWWPDANKRKRCLMLLTITAISAAALFLWQALYFSSWLPIPAVAKQGGDFASQLQRGTFYMLVGWLQNPLLFLALLASVIPGYTLVKQWFAGATPSLTAMLSVLCVCFWAYTGFVWTAGGDWMQAARFLVPTVIPASLILLYLLEKMPFRWLAHITVTVLVSLQFSIQYPIVATTSHGIPAWVKSRILPANEARYSIFERLNQEHVRDMAVIDHLADIIPVLHQQLKRPVQLMSGQAGMVFYYTASQFGDTVHFRDLRGLVESSLTLCPELKDIPRSAQGLFWGYVQFFERLPELEKTCGITAPDIIYDLNDMTQKMAKTLEPLGYVLIHRETGFVVENTTSLPYNRLLSPNMIFVRADLVPLLGNTEKRIINYADFPLHERSFSWLFY
jgi:hypothetical protein